MELHIVSDFRAAMKTNGFEVSFSVAAKILVDAGICDTTGTGYVVSKKITDAISAVGNKE